MIKNEEKILQRKYIKTKTGVYERLEPSEECPEVEDNHWLLVVNGIINKHSDPIIAEDDTIENLCDEFVLYDNQFKTYEVFDKKVITFNWLKNHLEIYKGMTIYGAIWTSKGLEFVAKMNSDGSLYLIYELLFNESTI